MQKGCKPKTPKNNNKTENTVTHVATYYSNFHQAFQPPQFPIIPNLDVHDYALKTTLVQPRENSESRTGVVLSHFPGHSVSTI